MDVSTVLPVIWFAIIGFGVMMYVLLDGFVLGIGALSPFVDDEHQRSLMMSTATPIWDGNETWLVLGAAGLYACFPKAYGVILSTLYLPVLMMLVALVFRGVAFEFRFKAHATRHIWDVAFAAGSILAAFSQGVILGALVNGLPLTHGGGPAGGVLDWYRPFCLLTGVAVVCGYALLGATWLVLKTEGRLQAIAFDLTRPLAVGVIVFMLLVSAWLPFLQTHLMHRWFDWPNLLYLSPVPVVTAVVAMALWRAIVRKREVAPFVLAMALFVLGFIGLALGLWPNIVPPDLSIWDAAAPPSSQGFTLVGAAIMIPVVLVYTVFSYRIFRGKVQAEDSYH
ncbi:cytochrome d ubiquinol oxidase subunit II [Oleiagrimonas sp. C23AA]|uniref:cytochrome d ubiquinol oxidase subunit II n=1 Tax=Oleiagrimonas sp. C23AA TaxID=2719047 RepID=UPI0014234B96|nr:cytochrome d ubiquinol oxidase subunit II [Oleiagrimonas sp. C23AA]NII09784.1 cytochrome d ubiquinol oxidase subunit II [Oleiagrimonas sp. C23AA]